MSDAADLEAEPHLAGSLAPSVIVDSDHPSVREFAARAADEARSDRDIAIALYYAVRDGFRYDPYTYDLSPGGLSASRVLETGVGWCVNKAVLLAAACRARGVPARLGFADVRNHLSTARMREMMGTDVFYYHGYVAVRIAGQWVKATPAFNIELCERFDLKPLEFDGQSDSLYHSADNAGRMHMEYLHDHGLFDDVPLERMLAAFSDRYQNLELGSVARFDDDVAAEARAPFIDQ
ncbi:transglutaminase family protein [soil metagenome]